MEKVSYDRCVYESEDDKSLSWYLSQKSLEAELFMQQRVNNYVANNYLFYLIRKEYEIDGLRIYCT